MYTSRRTGHNAASKLCTVTRGRARWSRHLGEMTVTRRPRQRAARRVRPVASRYGGVVAVDRRRSADRRGQRVRPDRSQRRRQDLDGRRAHRLHPARRGPGHLRRPRHHPPAALPARPAGPRRGPFSPSSCSTTSPSRRTCSSPASASASARRCATCSFPTGRPIAPASTGRSRSAACEDVVDRYPSEISLGQRKLVGVGRALALQPAPRAARRARGRAGHRREPRARPAPALDARASTG